MPFGFELLEQRRSNRSLRHLVQVLVVVKDVRQVEDLEFAGAERSELGERGREHLHGAQLQSLHFLAILEQRTVRVHLHLDPTLGPLLGEFLEVLRSLALWRIQSHDVAELDDDRRLGANTGVPSPRGQRPATFAALFQWGFMASPWVCGLSRRYRPIGPSCGA